MIRRKKGSHEEADLLEEWGREYQKGDHYYIACRRCGAVYEGTPRVEGTYCFNCYKEMRSKIFKELDAK